MRPLRVVSVIEAASITGPAKPLIEFAQRARNPLPGSDLPCADVSLLTFQRGEPGASNLFIDTVRQAGIEIDVIDEQRAFQPSIPGQLRRTIEARQPDIVETNAVKGHFLIHLLGLHKRYKWIACHHGYVSTNLKVLAYNQLDRWSLRGVDHMFTVCKPFARELMGIGVPENRITVRHNMIGPYTAPPADSVSRLREQYGLPQGIRIVFSGGRLSREKGHLDLVEAIGKLSGRSDLPPYRVLIAGEGPDRAAIEALTAQRNLKDRILLVGHQSSLHTWYGLADIVILPSHSEGSPLVLLEAMAAGLPIVATAVGGVPEIATDQVNTLLAARGDIDGLASSLVRLLSDETLSQRLGHAARDVVQTFTPEAYCRLTLGVYRRVVSGNPPNEPKLQEHPPAYSHTRR